MRRLIALAIRITASILLLLTISAWAVSRFKFVTIVAVWMCLHLFPTGVMVLIYDWGAVNVHIFERRTQHDHMTFEYPSQAEASEFIRWFPGGWFMLDVNETGVIVIRWVALIGYTALLNVVVYGLWWRRKRKAVPCED